MILFIILYLIGFLRTIIIIAVIYFAIRILTKYVIPILFDKKLKDMQQKMQEHQQQQQRNSRNEGDVTIEYDKRKRRNNDNEEGEYIDFEEIE
jgi:uncharacterized membrane protein (DUF106 family)